MAFLKTSELKFYNCMIFFFIVPSFHLPFGQVVSAGDCNWWQWLRSKKSGSDSALVFNIFLTFANFEGRRETKGSTLEFFSTVRLLSKRVIFFREIIFRKLFFHKFCIHFDVFNWEKACLKMPFSNNFGSVKLMSAFQYLSLIIFLRLLRFLSLKR